MDVKAAPTALIVDPDEDSRKLNAEIIKPLGFDIEESEDGADALACALARPPALVLTEARLPRVDGYTLCSLLRSDPVTQSTKILIVTASAFPSEMDPAWQAGADDVITKPTTPEQLRGRARAAIAHAQTLRDRSSETLDKLRIQMQRAQTLLERSEAVKRRMMSRTHHRASTTTPPDAPPALRCPVCDQGLTYQSSFVGGVSARFPEQWDTFACGSCGTFEYRHRTRKLRRV